MPPITNWQLPLHVASKPTSADAAGSIWAIDVPTWITAIATVGLLAGAIITALYAIRAFRAQAHEISDQGEMLKIQSGQLEEQRKINTEQMTVLGL